LEILKSREGKPAKFMLIRQAVADAKIKSFNDIYTFLFQQLDQYAENGKVGEYVINLQIGQFEDSMSVDKELCFMACIVKILNI